ncbi:MAG TPA: glycosyltransferase family 9 protein [Patescibacteria group bacterium]|nr:glycosyltransferase family 9 protein [Patescibacteria group bacterium]
MQVVNSIKIHENCLHFRGDIPCLPHKQFGVHCDGCSFYRPQQKSILIIKLGAIGDVIRTTPLLLKIQQEYPNAAIWWVTHTPEILPNNIHRILKFNAESLLVLQATEFDTIINLDKDPAACALLKLLEAPEKIGFTLKNGKPAPVDARAEHKFLTGIFDDVNQQNIKSYVQEAFEICGWEFKGEDYLLREVQKIDWRIPSGGRPIIGLNTGCGERWISRLWPRESWADLIVKLQKAGYCPILLGGRDEHEFNTNLSKETGAYYAGQFPLQQFISLMNECDVVVSGVTMAMHIAIALKKQLVLFNNIFNPYEFELYGRGEIIQPKNACQCFYSPKCTNPSYQCMDSLGTDQIFDAVSRSVSAVVER